jgi:hypothetical protein
VAGAVVARGVSTHAGSPRAACPSRQLPQPGRVLALVSARPRRRWPAAVTAAPAFTARLAAATAAAAAGARRLRGSEGEIQNHLTMPLNAREGGQIKSRRLSRIGADVGNEEARELHWQRDGMALVRESWDKGTKCSQEKVKKSRLYHMLLPLGHCPVAPRT